MIIKKNITKHFIYFFFHLFMWTLVPSISNVNLPLDVIEALAWGSNLDWGLNDIHLLALLLSILFLVFGKNDWAYYLLNKFS